MFRQTRYPPHRAFDSTGVERRTGSGQTSKNVIMGHDLDKRSITFVLMLECIEETGLLMIGDDENALDERGEFDDGDNVRL
ncbi:hypothetical protein [Brucella cytisi]|uniref:hypothetical protein n=1 Tax=Brucella cytisi TaxID=407152 RepID=UPI001F36A4CB|nr:hypothetical protein [Brucella cytisi]